jgi:probable phosphoglycerate mutase
MSAIMLLYLVRHGQSTYNAEGRIQGQSDCALSEHGRRQGAAAAKQLANLPIEAIYASPLQRASETAQFLADLLSLDIRFDPRLKEVHAGRFQDQIRKEIMQRFPDAIPRWRSGDPDFAFPDGESRRELIERGHSALREVIAAGHEHAAVVSHGGLLLSAIKALLEIPSDAPPFGMRNASITRLAVDAEGRVEMLDFDNIEHLAGLEVAPDE